MIDYLKKFRLDGKTAVVCGGLGLIGKQISMALSQAGARTLVLDINEEQGKEFEKENPNTIFIQFDITNFDEYQNNLTHQPLIMLRP